MFYCSLVAPYLDPQRIWVGSIIVIEASKVDIGDHGNNFMLDESGSTLSGMLGSQKKNAGEEDSMRKLDRICREANVMLIFTRSYGLIGFVRISVKEHTIVESKNDHFMDDLWLNNPGPELRRFAAHKRTYVIILVKMTDKWTKS